MSNSSQRPPRRRSRKMPTASSRGHLHAWKAWQHTLLLSAILIATGCAANDGWKPGAPDTVQAERLRLESEFSNFLFALETFVLAEDKTGELSLKKSRLPEVVQLVFDEQDWNKEAGKAYYAELSDGVDPWGHEILFIESETGVWTLRSPGPNSIDEGGGGDDVEASVNLSGSVGK